MHCCSLAGRKRGCVTTCPHYGPHDKIPECEYPWCNDDKIQCGEFELPPKAKAATPKKP